MKHRPHLKHRHRWILPAIVLLAFGIRVVAAIAVQQMLDNSLHRQFLIEGDAAGYWELGGKLAAGEEYSIYSPPRYTMRMPGFPALLALSISVAGENFFAARILLAAVGTLACWLVYGLGRELFDRKVGLIAALLAAVAPAFVGFSVLILSETLFAAALLLSLVTLAKLINTGFGAEAKWRGVRWSLGAGASIAAACYVRPSWLLAAPLFAAFYVVLSSDRKQAAVRGGLVIAATVVTLLPWGVRNQRATGHFVLTTMWLGPSLYDGLNPQATGASDMQFMQTDDVAHLSEYELDQHYRRQAKQFVSEYPGRTAELALIKLGKYWKPWPNAEQFGSVWQRLVVAAFFVPALALALRGLWITRGTTWPWLLTFGPILYFAAIHAIFVASLRYRLPAEYPLLVLTAVGVSRGLIRHPKTQVSDSPQSM